MRCIFLLFVKCFTPVFIVDISLKSELLQLSSGHQEYSLANLNSFVVWIVSILPFISNSSSLLLKIFGTISNEKSDFTVSLIF